MPTASINGFEMYYETKGEGFPVVFNHGGFGGLGTGLQPVVPAWMERVAGHFQVITYDRRAAGRSSDPGEGFTMENFARDVRELLRHLGHDRAHAWGTSAGGQIALATGLQYPEATTSVVISDSAPWLSLDEELKGKLRDRIKVLNEEGPEAAYQARGTSGTVGLNLFVGRQVQSEEDKRALEERRQRIRAALRDVPREERLAKYAGELRTYSAYVDWDATPRLREMKPPTLVVYGTEDTVFPSAGSRTMVELIPNVECKAFQGADHGVQAFPETIDLIVSFLERHTLP